MMKKIVVILLFLAGKVCCMAQSIGPATMNTAGGNGQVGATTIEYSIGEMAVVSTQSNSNITITHGILQPQSNIAEGITDETFASNNLSIYPNPSTAEIFIKVLNSDVKINFIELLDVSGKLIAKQNKPILQSNIIYLPIDAYADGIYLLRISSTVLNKNCNFTYTISKSK
jgi:Secretion system C-terminal sorting domain